MPKQKPITDALIIEASAWLVRMNGSLRDRDMEQGFLRWANEDPRHREAFVEVSKDWEHLADHRQDAYIVVRASAPSQSPVVDRKKWRTGSWLAAAAVLFLTAASGLFHYFQMGSVETAIGERRILTLADGSTVSLNTSTRIVMQYEKERRLVRLDAGEALFDVAKDPGRPFIVDVGDQQVTALGTAFLVRRDREQLAVTLVEGKVSVTPSTSGEKSDGARAVILEPGERLIFSQRPEAVVQMDRPRVEKLLAWQQGQVDMDRLRLSDAVAEMNRYSSVRIVIEHPEIADLPISGVFIAGQSASFVRAVANSYGLTVGNEGSIIKLGGVPQRGLPMGLTMPN